MEMVSSSKFRVARRNMESSRPYYSTVLENIQNLLSATGNINHPYLDEREVKNSLYIVMASDRGLAGGYNSNVMKLAENKIKEATSDSKLITIGSKSFDYFSNRKYNIIKSYTGISEDPLFSDAREIGNIALEMFKNGEIDEIILVYTEFVSTISQVPKVIRLLPSEKVKEEASNKRSSIIEFEPSEEEVLDYLIPKYVQSTIFGALIEASASEQAARRVAMEAATDNAEEIIDELEISYNRARQAAITMEISEIVSGAEALK